MSTSRTKLLGYLSTTLIRGHQSPAGVTAGHLGGHTQAQMSLCHRRGKARAARSARRSGGTRGCRLSSRPPQPFLSPSPTLGPPTGSAGSSPTPSPLLPSMVSADFCTAAVLVSTGAVLGRVNPVQMLLLTLLGVTLVALNEYILLSLMGVSQ